MRISGGTKILPEGTPLRGDPVRRSGGTKILPEGTPCEEIRGYQNLVGRDPLWGGVGVPKFQRMEPPVGGRKGGREEGGTEEDFRGGGSGAH